MPAFNAGAYDTWKTSYPDQFDGPDELELEGDRLFYADADELEAQGYTEVAPTAAAMFAAGIIPIDWLTPEDFDAAEAILTDLSQSHIRPASKAA